MPFPQIAKNNLVVALSLGSFLTDDRGQYRSLSEQITDLEQIMRMTSWQRHHPYQSAYAGNNQAKSSLLIYLNVESSIDLFMRFGDIPSFQVNTNLAYLDGNFQRFALKHFTDTILRKNLCDKKVLSAAAIKKAITNLVKEKVLGYAGKLPGQSDEDWQIFVAEVNTGIEYLCMQFHAILKESYDNFDGFRKGHLNFIHNYFEKCNFLASLEEWLLQAPRASFSKSIENSSIALFSQKSLELIQNYNEIDMRSLHSQLDNFRRSRVTEEQYKSLCQLLIGLKPKYDAYRFGQAQLNQDQQLTKFMELWPKPKLPTPVPPSKQTEAEETWQKSREKSRKKREEIMYSDDLRHKPSTAKLG